MAFATVAGHRIEYELVGGEEPAVTAAPSRPVLVFLHEGLGSVAMWRDFPARVVEATGCAALVYSRRGYGRSEPVAPPRPVTYMHDEALVDLPELLDALGVHRPVLVGHSDGGSIALIHAAASGRPVSGLVLMAPHVMVEDLSVSSIAAAKVAYETTDLRARLGRYHDDVDSAFWGWNGVWLDPAFRLWNIEAYLPRIRCPVLALQGVNDEYGTMAQVESITRAVKDVEVVALERCGHSPHRDRADATLEAIARFVARINSLSPPGRGSG